MPLPVPVPVPVPMVVRHGGEGCGSAVECFVRARLPSIVALAVLLAISCDSSVGLAKSRRPRRPPATKHVPRPVHVPKPALGEDRAKVRAWVETVALGTEFGGEGKIAARWTKPVRFSVMKGDQRVRKDMLELILTLNLVLAPAGAPITVVGDGDADAELKVYFVPLAQFDGIARRHGFTYVQGNHGFFQTFWNTRHELTRAFILMATDKLSGAPLRHFSFEELTQSLGLANDSPAFPDSIFFANGADGGRALSLSALDRKLLSFFYTRVQPGDGEREVRAAFAAHWK